MNLPDELINNTIRISFGWQNSEEDVNRLIEAWLRIYQVRTKHTQSFKGWSMPRIIFIEENGIEKKALAEIETILEVARANDVNIEGACGGIWHVLLVT